MRAGTRGGILLGMLGTMATCATFALSGCRASTPRDVEREFLARTWDAYKQQYLDADGFILDRSRGGGEVTSEGQGYALLRAVWMRDEDSFSRLLAWTQKRLRRPDGLYSWRWSPKDGGQILDRNTASDADQEIAFALVLGSVAFQKPELLAQASELLRAIRRHEAIEADGTWFPAAGNWAVDGRIVNISYFLPYAYPYFARVDPEGQWSHAIDAGYRLIASALRWQGSRLVPDFMVMTRAGSAEMLPVGTPLSRDFSSDAMRIFWRVAVDCRLHGRLRACVDPLEVRNLTALVARDGILYTRYTLDGSPLERIESGSFYGIALPYLLLHAPAAGRALRSERLAARELDFLTTDRNRYYDANWIWFGLAAADDVIAQRTPALAVLSQR